MAHNFELHELSDDNTIMVCKCGLSFRWYRGTWKRVEFEDEYGHTIDPPPSCNDLGESGEEEEEA